MANISDYVAKFPDDKTFSLRDAMEFTIQAETDVVNIFSGETLLGYLLAIRDFQLACCKKQITTMQGNNGMEK
jgi:hypothetical protein